MVTGGGAVAAVPDAALVARAAAAAVVDPELPSVTIGELGILRDVVLDGTGAVEVTITPTYSGCPAMDVIRADVRTALRAAGFDRVTVGTVLAPAWTTDWISPAGRDKLAAAGIAPPEPVAATTGPVPVALSVPCPRCGCARTRELSRFGATACKALWRCLDCAEPFERVKAL